MKDQNRKNNGQKENGQEKNAQGDREWREAAKDRWEQQQPYIHWMAGVDGIGSRTMEKLIQYAGSPKEVYEMTASETEKIISARKAAALEEARKRGDALERYREMEEKGIRFYSLYHPRYPSRLRNIPDSPYGIYVEGELPEEGIPSVAVIGSRQCSGYGQFMAELCGKELAAAGIHIISGMARGIDGISQRAALEAGGKIYAILGSGTDICYPSENRSIYVGAKTSGAVISEYPPGTSPSPLLFPRRNRIISGLADLVLIIEARRRSGTLITADMALEQGKEVYALPGRITDALSEGCNRLLQQGANVVVSAEDMIRGLTGRSNLCGTEKVVFLSDMQKALLQNLDDMPQSLEMIKERMLLNNKEALSTTELMGQLVKLSLTGYVKQIGNSYFVRETFE